MNGMINLKKNSMDLVSIIVPIYNVEKYLKKCVDSILKQTYMNIEVILVDDGSPDNSGCMCDDYKKNDERVKVIHKRNGGLSSARNEGLKIATGKYIAFIDSDDYISHDYIEYLYNNIIKYDADISIILPLNFSVSPNIKKYEKEQIKIYNGEDSLYAMLYQKEFDNAAWGKLYNKTIVENIDFPLGKLYEDIGTTYKYLLKAKVVVFSSLQKYYYLQRKDSIMGSKFKIKEMDYIYQSEIMMKDIEQIGNKNLLKAAHCRYVNANFSILLKIKHNNIYKNERKKIITNIKKYQKEVFFDKNCRLKTKLGLFLLRIGVI